MTARLREVTGGRVWTAQGPIDADLLIDASGRIEAVQPRSPGASVDVDVSPSSGERLDARGLWVLPGAVDVHVHFRDPGLTHKEDFLTGSAQAAVGGVTTVLDMPNTLPPVSNAQRLKAKMETLRGRSFVDYGVFGTAVAGKASGSDAPNSELIAVVEEMVQAGACGVKLFLGPTTGDIEAPGWGQLYNLLNAFSGRETVFAFHCEDRNVIERAQVDFRAVSEYQALLLSRPRFGELLATDGALRLAMETGARVHIAHVALKEAAAAIARAKDLGAPVTAETCPQYLFLSEDDYPWARHLMKALPPIRSLQDQQGLWDALKEGVIDAVATDHAPHETTQPASAVEPPYGMAGVQSMLPLLLDAAIRGRCGVDDVVRWTSENPAKAYGLHPNKGSLSPGADADFVLIDPQRSWRLDASWWRGKSQNTAFWGKQGMGLPVATALRGALVARDGDVIGRPQGRLLHGGGS